jgi:hypothetical protein
MAQLFTAKRIHPRLFKIVRTLHVKPMNLRSHCLRIIREEIVAEHLFVLEESDGQGYL